MKILSRRLVRTPFLMSLALATISPGAVADDPSVDRLLASHCAQCHGTNGYATGEFESLAGEEAKDLYEDLTDMKGEDRPEDIMDHQALGYSDDQIRRIADFYATLPEEGQGSSASEEDQNPEQQQDRDQNEDQEDQEDQEDEEDKEDKEED